MSLLTQVFKLALPERKASFVPHIFTSGNLLCGVLSIVFIFRGELLTASKLVLVAALLDFLDGFVARMLRVSGEFGKQLDSLADAVTFGATPALMFYYLADEALRGSTLHFLSWAPLLIAVFSALRLAKFNLDPRQAEGFIGVPTPAMATFFIGLPFLFEKGLFQFVLHPYAVAGITVLACYLLVSEIPIFSLKFKVFSFRENSWRYAFLLLIIILFLVYKFAALTPIVLVYILMSIIKNLIQR